MDFNPHMIEPIVVFGNRNFILSPGCGCVDAKESSHISHDAAKNNHDRNSLLCSLPHHSMRHLSYESTNFR